MRILHTSDLHLREDRPETIRALKELLRIASERGADLMTIGGDIFHSKEDAEVLRPKLREIFSGDGPEVLAIPGNHDADAYREDLNWGSKITVATEEPFSTFEYEGFAIIALPFKDELTTSLYDRLQSVSDKHSKSALLLHCTLDIGYSSEDFGEEESVSYFPVTRETLREWGFDYVLAGHFHRNQSILKLGEEIKFIYPGSPVSHSWSELGKRKAVLVDVESGEEEGLSLDTFYRDECEKVVRPGEEEELVEEIGVWVDERVGDDCEIRVIPRGHVRLDEKEFTKMLEEACEGAELTHEFYRSVKPVLNHPLFRRFKESLDSRDDIDDKEAVEEMALDAMSRLLANRELRS
ncbi:hypothetical protein AKJ54_00215 [candidate division MSBL1 archaeon SCGC-AAA382K21]|uniref:Calcineurin-like phosphoesterase domain-containing protein n=1 Tax=candidate division MSBL1 archaeon SCGC-AAA382K21 TaxID=1698283 RepID=A0A133VM34_9EURY|nr:hypothetical protein AKJ54_00215 [candidate division MSBL1 archaeon SCGC-AAA382K21]